MDNDEIKNRIKELELELSNLKSGKVTSERSTHKATTQGNNPLNENVDRFLSLADNIPSYIAYINADTLQYEFVNELYVKSIGIPREKIIGSHIKDVIGEKSYNFVLKYIKEVKSGRSASYENPYDTSSGKRWLQVNYSPDFDDNSKVIGIGLFSQDITKRRQVEEELRKSEENICSILDSTPFPVALVDTQDNIIKYWSRSAFTLFGHTPPTANEWYQLAYPDDEYRREVIGRWKAFLEKAQISSEPVNTGEYRVTCSDGSVLICELYATFLENYLIVTFNNITKSKQFEKAVLESEERFNKLFNQAPLGYQSLDFDGKFIEVNQQWLDTLGYTREEVIGKWFGDFLSPMYLDGFRKRFPIFKAEGKIHSEFEMVHKNGKKLVIAFDGRIGYDFNGEFMQTHCILQDITERKQTEQKLLRSEHELKKAQQITHIGSWYLDVATNEVKWSEELYKMYGFNPELPPPPYNEHMKLFTPESWEILTSSLAKTSETGVPYELELQTIRKDGSNGWMWVRGEAQTDSEGKIFGLWGAAQDISEHKEREEQLKDALEKATEADRLKSAFLANMSHEIRTPMNGILGFAELLKEPRLTLEKQQDFIQIIQICGARLLNTINSIIDISKIESGLISVNINEANINEKMEFTYKFFKPDVENKGLKFLFKNGLPSNEAIIKTDNEKVYGILTNLIKNAIRFTNEGLIEFGYVLKRDSEPGSTEQGRSAELEFYIKDTGVGIPENQKKLIFERFRQGSDSLNRNYEGSGLGLSICKSYVEMLGGKIWVESHEGVGSIFYFTIPYNPVSEKARAIENLVLAENKEVQLKKLKILIVEDDEISYSLLTKILEKNSEEVLHAITGVEAVEACRNNPDFDLVLMDIRMPQMNGLEATQQIRKFNKDVIIIAQTAYGFSSDSEKALKAGCNDYITKPINKTSLFELIKRHCRI